MMGHMEKISRKDKASHSSAAALEFMPIIGLLDMKVRISPRLTVALVTCLTPHPSMLRQYMKTSSPALRVPLFTYLSVPTISNYEVES